MNIFRLIGDLLHLLSILLLLRKMYFTRSCAGISLKTTVLYMIVFVTRYLDIVFVYISLYNTLMKLFYMLSTGTIIFLTTQRYSATYDREHDNFRIVYLLVPCALLALVINDEFEFFEIVWAFSIYLEAVAIFPQLVLLQRTREVETLTADYVVALGAYRFFYIINWIYRYYADDGSYTNWFVYAAGIVQTALYIDFFYYYVKSKWYGQKIMLPT
mmetsp:Transcript_13311/g.53050  ORF Transcript_13311/g.53050 Transcript_13311/m.53050 type:complete len:215 (-) Transcript_13311:64-708(-)